MLTHKVRRSSLLAYIAMIISFMSSISLFHGKVGTLQWIFFYYGSVLLLLILSFYYITRNEKVTIRKEIKFFVLLFCIPRILMLIYSIFIWIGFESAFPYISRGISNTLFQCAAYFCGVCFAYGEKHDILKITLSSAVSVFGLAYIIGFMQNGFSFIISLNPFGKSFGDYGVYKELHELSYVIGLYILISLITKKNTSLKKENWLFWLSIVFFIIAWKRIGIFSVIMAYLYFIIFSRCKRTKKNFLIKMTGLVGTAGCLIYVALVMSGKLMEILNFYGIEMMGRDIIYRYFIKQATLSPMYLGKGVGFVTRQFDYATRADLYNMVSVKAVHNDFLKMYIEIGFIGFVLWVFWWLIQKVAILEKKYGVEKAFICLLLIVYAFILYTTDNTESYTNFQMHLSALITYVACFYTDKTSGKET